MSCRYGASECIDNNLLGSFPPYRQFCSCCKCGTAHTASWKFSVRLLCTSTRTASGRRQRWTSVDFLPLLVVNLFFLTEKWSKQIWLLWVHVLETSMGTKNLISIPSGVFEWSFMYLENGCTLETPSQIALSEPRSRMCSAVFSKLGIMAIFQLFLEANVICAPPLVVPL